MWVWNPGPPFGVWIEVPSQTVCYAPCTCDYPPEDGTEPLETIWTDCNPS
jgi:hypothetical protein